MMSNQPMWQPPDPERLSAPINVDRQHPVVVVNTHASAQQTAHHYPPLQYPYQVSPKSPGLAVLASCLIPGLGSMISGNGGIGALILILNFISWLLTIVLIGFIMLPCIWVWGMVQAHADAVRWNAQHGIIS